MRVRTLWVFSELYAPEVTSTGHYLTAMAEHLAAVLAPEGIAVAVLCGQPTYAARGQRLPRRERRGGVTVHRCSGTTFDKDRLAGRLANTVTLTASTTLRALGSVRRGDVVVAVSNPPTMPAIAALAGRVRGARTVPLFHDVLPVVLETVAGRPAGSPMVRVARALVAVSVRRAAAVVTVSRASVAEVVGMGAEVDRTVVIPTWADADVHPPVGPEDPALGLRRAMGLLDKRVALFAGNFGRANQLDVVLDAAEHLRARRDLALVLCGEGPRRRWVEGEVRRRVLDNVYLAGPFPRSRQVEMFAVGDVSLVPLAPGMGRSSMPSRAYNSLAAGLPIVALADEGSELATLVREHDVGWVGPPGDAAALAVALETALDDPTPQARRERALAAAAGPCSAAVALASWTDLVRAVLDGAPIPRPTQGSDPRSATGPRRQQSVPVRMDAEEAP